MPNMEPENAPYAKENKLPISPIFGLPFAVSFVFFFSNLPLDPGIRFTASQNHQTAWAMFPSLPFGEYKAGTHGPIAGSTAH